MATKNRIAYALPIIQIMWRLLAKSPIQNCLRLVYGERAGVVVSGDYSGKSIYIRNDYSFMIISNDENGKIIVKSLFPTRYSILKEISKTTVDHYEDVSAIETGADASAVAKGLFLAGPAGGLLGAVASKSATYDLAIYFKDGEKSLIRILSSGSYQELKRILFEL